MPLRFPVLYIGQAVPEGWQVDYSTVKASSLKELRTFVGAYSQIKAEYEVGLDVREADKRCYSSLLKLMEDSNLKLHLRINEPVIDTIISRAGTIVKKDKVDIQPLVMRLVEDDGSLGTKIRGLFGKDDF